MHHHYRQSKTLSVLRLMVGDALLYKKSRPLFGVLPKMNLSSCIDGSRAISCKIAILPLIHTHGTCRIKVNT